MIFRLLPLAACLAFALPAQAERADRDKPMQVEAQKMTIDDAKKIQILEGDVVVTKGTIVLRTDRLVVTEDQYGFQKGVAFGGPGGLARFKQKREGKDEYVEGEAERIEYNTRNEIAELFHRAWIKSGADEVRGDYIWYDSIAEKYLATAGDPDPKATLPPRVRAIIQPKSKGAPPNEPPARLKGDALILRGDKDLVPSPDAPWER